MPVPLADAEVNERGTSGASEAVVTSRRHGQSSGGNCATAVCIANYATGPRVRLPSSPVINAGRGAPRKSSLIVD